MVPRGWSGETSPVTLGNFVIAGRTGVSDERAELFGIHMYPTANASRMEIVSNLPLCCGRPFLKAVAFQM